MRLASGEPRVSLSLEVGDVRGRESLKWLLPVSMLLDSMGLSNMDV